MSNPSDSVERIAADILIAALNSSIPNNTRSVESICDSYKKIHEAVKSSKESQTG